MKAVLLVVAFLALPIGLAQADAVMNCPHVWQQGNVGHGGSCTTDWPAVGGGGAVCAFVGILVAAGLLFAMRSAPAGKGRGE